MVSWSAARQRASCLAIDGQLVMGERLIVTGIDLEERPDLEDGAPGSGYVKYENELDLIEPGLIRSTICLSGGDLMPQALCKQQRGPATRP